VVICMEPRCCDLHATVEDQERMRGLPLLAAQHVEDCRRNEVLLLPVAVSADVESGVVLQFEPHMLRGVNLPYQAMDRPWAAILPVGMTPPSEYSATNRRKA
jgi:hypothetical protein